MLTAIVITPDSSLTDGIQRLALASRQVTVQKTVDHYASPYELVRLLNVSDPDLVFLDLSDWSAASPIAASLRDESPQTAILGIGGSWMQRARDQYFEAGVDVLLVTPLDLPEFQAAVLRAFRMARGEVLNSLIAFLPAKAGNGCSITAFNAAGALAGELGRKTLLIEGDLHSGILCIRARFATERSLEHVLEDPSVLNHSQWLRHIVTRHGVDILPAGRSRVRFQPRWSNYYHLLRYADSEYETVIADLPETINDASAEVVLRASKIYIVSTAEKPSLDLACRRSEEPDELGVNPNRVEVVINRWHPADTPPEELEPLLQRRVAKALPNDYQSVRRATDEGRLVSSDVPLGGAYRGLARQLAGLPDTASEVREEGLRGRFRLAALLGR